MTTLCLVPGTHGGTWAEPGSALRTYLTRLGFHCILFPWSYDTGGVPSLTDAVIQGLDSDWVAGGYATRDRIRSHGLSYLDLNFVAHSHGIEPLIMQAILPPVDEGDDGPIPIRSLISICSPPYEKSVELSKQARTAGMIGYHKHIHAIGWDLWARLGQAFGGGYRADLEWEGAENVGIEGIGHTGLLDKQEHWPRLAAELAVITGSAAHV